MKKLILAASLLGTINIASAEYMLKYPLGTNHEGGLLNGVFNFIQANNKECSHESLVSEWIKVFSVNGPTHIIKFNGIEIFKAGIDRAEIIADYKHEGYIYTPGKIVFDSSYSFEICRELI